MPLRLDALAALITSLALATGALASDEDVAGFCFDGAFNQRGGLTFSFDRNIDTLDEAAKPVAENTPRYANPRLFCGALNEVDTVADQVGLNFMFSSHGCDNDSLTPLSAIINKTRQRIQVYRGEDATEVTNNTLVHPVSGIMDMLNGAVPDKAFSPRAIVVCHGLILVFCETWMPPNDGGAWFIRSSAVVMSNDLGQSWQLVYERPGLYSDQLTRDIGSTWAMQNWYRLDTNPGPPTEVWIPITDYRKTPKDGGDLVLVRARRLGPGDPWSIDPVNDVKQVVDHDGPNGQHFHAAGIVPHGENGIALYVLVGDRPNDMIVKICRDDMNFTEGPASFAHRAEQNGWRTFEAHGPLTALEVEVDGEIINPIRRGNQGVGLSQGPDPKSLLVGGDEQEIGLLRIDHDDRWDTGITHTMVFNPTTQGHGRWVLFKLHSVEGAEGPWVTSARHVPSGAPGGHSAIYSPDGVHFGAFAPPMRISNKESGATATHFWWNDGEDLFRVRFPAWSVMRPLMVGPGGTNLLRPTLTADAPDDGIERFDLPAPPGGTPPVQSFSDRTFLVTCDSIGPNIGFGTFQLTENQPLTMGERVYVKFHNYAYGYDGGTAGGYDPDAPGQGTNPRAGNWLCSPIFSTTINGGPASVRLSRSSSCVADHWLPMSTVTKSDNWDDGSIDIPLGTPFDLRTEIIGGTEGEGCWHKAAIAFESVSVGDYLGYPIRPGTTGPDEVATVEGLDAGDDWVVYGAGMVPVGDWDFEMGADEKRIFSIKDDESGGWIDLIARPISNRIDLHVHDPLLGQDPIAVLQLDVATFKREHPLLLAVRKAGESLTLKVGLNGLPMQTAAITVPSWRFLPLKPDSLRFGSSTPSAASASFWWAGGGVDRNGCDAVSDMESRLRSLDFLVPPAPCDLDGDGTVSVLDLLTFVDDWIKREPSAEFDGMEPVTVLDLLVYVDCWLENR